MFNCVLATEPVIELFQVYLYIHIVIGNLRKPGQAVITIVAPSDEKSLCDEVVVVLNARRTDSIHRLTFTFHFANYNRTN